MHKYQLPSRLSFFAGYYFKKHFGGKITEKDIFFKRLLRTIKKLPGELYVDENGEMIYETYVNDRKLHLVFRAEGSIDIQVLDQIFAKKEYLPLINEIIKRKHEESIGFIIDAGCNVGYAGIYFKTNFPGAVIKAVEPDASNKQQAEKNFYLNAMKNIEVLQAGVWPTNAFLELRRDFMDGKEWSFYVTESEKPTDLKGISLLHILEQSGFPQIDILKIDIEGGEKELFRDRATMDPVLQRTRYLAIEIHDETGMRQVICESLKRNGFDWFDVGQTTFATNTKEIN